MASADALRNAAAALYNERFAKFGRDMRTVGWGKQADQLLRFDVLFRGLDPMGKTILDVGCGLGDLVQYLQARCGTDFQYVGVDVAEKLLEDARAHSPEAQCRFVHGDVFSADLSTVDIAVLSGALSLRIDGMTEYASHTLARMYALSREAACLNFLSTRVDYTLEKNQHFAPETVLQWALAETRHVTLHHDYPLYEFTVQLHRAPTE